jgi:hypothetical protein
MPFRLARASGYALLFWIIGFVWGVIVFTVPTLRNVPSVSYVSKYPAISIPLLVTYPILMFFTTRTLLKETIEHSEGARFGVVVLVVNVVFDSFVYVVFLKSIDYFTYLSIWFAYIMFLTVPWLTGIWLKRKSAS